MQPIRHWSYAIQWWAFAVVTLIFWAVASRKKASASYDHHSRRLARAQPTHAGAAGRAIPGAAASRLLHVLRHRLATGEASESRHAHQPGPAAADREARARCIDRA